MNQALGFKVNIGIAQIGTGKDQAIVYDSADSDVFTANSGDNMLYALDATFSAPHYDEIMGFPTIDAYSLIGSTDVVTDHDPAHVFAFGFGLRH